MISEYIKKNFFLYLLIFILFVLVLVNYQPGTYLSGWDTLHPEFDFGLNLKRIIFGVWREEQGLGAVTAHSHMSELPRVILLWIFHFFLPLSFLRYAYVFLCLLLGPTGVYFFLDKVILKKQSKLIRQSASFLGSLFYLLNFGTMQNFYVPFEMFPTQFAFIGWIFLFAFKFLEEGGKKNLLLFSAFVLFSTPMAYASQLWFAFFLFFIIFIFSYSIKKGAALIKKFLILILLLITLNSFWLLPNLYYIKNHSTVPQNAKTNRISSEDFFYYNKKFGTIKETALLKNFYYNWMEYNFVNNRYEYLMQEWKKHLEDKIISTIGYIFFFLVLIGLFLSFFKYKNFSFSLSLSFILYFFLIANNTFLISNIFEFYRTNSPLFKEALRFPFTKFSIVLMFIYALCFGIFFTIFFNFLEKRFNKKNLIIIYTTLFLISYSLYLYMKPAFFGYLIDPQMKIKIPNEYFKLGKFLKEKQNNGRILKLPIHTYAGWLYYQWGYQGAGLNWFNIKQPTLDRDFDRWYPQNEQAFREFFYAVYSKNQDLFEKLLLKYNIQYILLDENVIIPGDENQEKKLFYPEIKALIANLPTIKLTQKFGEKISLFEFLPNQRKKPIEILTDYKVIEPSYRWNYVDEAYQKHGNYITYLKRPQSIIDYIYPGRNILTEQEKINQKILTIGENSYQINFSKTSLLENGEIKIPSLSTTESEFYTEVYAKKKGEKIIINLKYLLPYLTSDQVYTQELELPSKNSNFFSLNDKIFHLPTYLSDNPTYLGEEILFTQKENHLGFYNNKPIPLTLTNFTTIYPYLCSPPQENQIFGAETTVNGFKIYGQRAKICLSFLLKELVSLKKEGALRIKFNYKIKEGGKADFCLFDNLKNKCLFTKNLKPSFSPQVDFFLPINHVNSNSLSLNFSFDTQEDTVIRELLIKDLNFDFYEEEDKKSFLAEIPPFKTITKEFKLEGKFPQEKVNLTAENIGMEKNDCGFEKAKFIDKQFIEDGRDVILEYKAKDGAICDSIPLLNLSQNMAYLLSIESQNVSGLPLKICLKNAKSEICDLEERLSKNKKMAIDYFLIPPYHNGYGYYLLLNNYSIGEVLTINRIKSIRLIPFPYNFFQSIKWQNKNNEIIPMNQSIKIEINKNLPYLYKAEISSPPPPTHHLIVLNQAFEKNWKAYLSETCNVKSITCKIKNIFNLFFPFIFGKEIKEHVIVNNWANGFILSSNTKLLTSNTNKFNIIIVFLPQYLEFLGFLMMGVGFLIVIKIKHQESHLD